MNIWLASGNTHKREELSAILEGHTLCLPAEAGITRFDPEESGGTFMENALIKAKALYRLLAGRKAADCPAVLADDSGLCVDILGGRPGIYSARYRGKNTQDEAAEGGGKLSDGERNALLLEEVYAAARAVFGQAAEPGSAQSGVSAGGGADDGQAFPGLRCRFVCAMVLLQSPDRFYAVQETLEGEIVPSAGAVRGGGGFGYDPIVYLPERGCTVAELAEEEKNSLSHRGKAGRAIAQLVSPSGKTFYPKESFH